MKYLVLWDIHWQYEKLEKLITEYFVLSDKVIFLWDYIDKNKDSLKCLKYILNLKQEFPNKVEILWWNHDIFLINSLVYKDDKLFKVWFYINQAFSSTLFDYVPWNDQVLLKNWYVEFIPEYFEKLSNDEGLFKLGKELLDFGKLFYKDENALFVHGGIPLKVIRRDRYQIAPFYKNKSWLSWLEALEEDYKNWNSYSIDFFSDTKNNDPTWYLWASKYQQITKETFLDFISKLGISSLFIWHQSKVNSPKFPKDNSLFCLNMWHIDIGYFYWEINGDYTLHN